MLSIILVNFSTQMISEITNSDWKPQNWTDGIFTAKLGAQYFREKLQGSNSNASIKARIRRIIHGSHLWGRICTIYHSNTEITAPLDMPLLTKPNPTSREEDSNSSHTWCSRHTSCKTCTFPHRLILSGCVKVTWQPLLEKMKMWGAVGIQQVYLWQRRLLKIKAYNYSQ